jgi:hypothetical protein
MADNQSPDHVKWTLYQDMRYLADGEAQTYEEAIQAGIIAFQLAHINNDTKP